MIAFPQFQCGSLTAAVARDSDALDAVLTLRQERFRSRSGGQDLDRFDQGCSHVMISDAARVLATARVRLMHQCADMQDSYAAQFYDFKALFDKDAVVLEIGRLCISAAHCHDPDILRMLLAAVTRIVLAHDVSVMIGCSSLSGADIQTHKPVLRYLAAHHLAPAPHLLRGRCDSVPLPRSGPVADVSAHLPPLLRLYLGLGGWVSDHAVRDTDLDTLHVFTAVEVARIPATRRRFLEALASDNVAP